MSRTTKHPTETLVQVSSRETVVYTVSPLFAAVVKAVLDGHELVYGHLPRPRSKMTLERAVEVAKGRLTPDQIGEFKVERCGHEIGVRGFKADPIIIDNPKDQS